VKRIFVFLLLAGCGYSFRSIINSEYKKIYIPVVKNEIKIEESSPNYRLYYPGLEIDLTKAIIDRFIYDGNLKPISDEDKADVVLKAVLNRYDRQALRYSSQETIEEFRLILEADVSLYDVKKGKEVFKDKVIGDTTYFTGGTNVKTESEAIQDLVKDLARRIVDKVVEGW
jgi:outer membrane lipopolysaccharide assembly protein LptE/RlpB